MIQNNPIHLLRNVSISNMVGLRGFLTTQDQDSICNRVNDRLQGGDACHPTVEVVVRAKVPTSEPHGDIIPHSKEPNDGKVGKRNYTRAIRHVAENLVLITWKTAPG